MGNKFKELDVYVESIGAADDHVHILFRTGPRTTLSEIVQQVKGYASYAWNHGSSRQAKDPLYWQDGYFAETVTPDESGKLRDYVARQRLIHEAREAVHRWEPPTEEG
jgi:REP element-mobilizing transposase RayT